MVAPKAKPTPGQTPDEAHAAHIMDDAPRAMKEAAELWAAASPDDKEQRNLASRAQVAASLLLWERMEGFSQKDWAPLLALSGALNDHDQGVKSELLAVRKTHGKPLEEHTTRDHIKAVCSAAVSRFKTLGLLVGEAERIVGGAAGASAAEVHNWRKLSRFKDTIIYKEFAFQIANADEKETLAALKRFLSGQP